MGSEAARWHLAHRRGEGSFRAQARAALDRLPEGPLPVLDLGCGTAPLGPDLRAAGHEWTGLDRDPDMLTAAREREAGGRFVRGAADALPFAGETFKAVVSLGLFEYLPAPGAALCEIRRVLVPGGVAILSVPRRDAPFRRALAAAAPFLRAAGRHDPFDLRAGRRLDPPEMGRRARSAGLVLADSRPVAPLLVPWPFDRFLAAPRGWATRPALGTAWLYVLSPRARPRVPPGTRA